MFRLIIACLAFELVSIGSALDVVVIDGFWSPWSARASPCFMSPTDQTTIVQCGVGFTRRYRSCTNPTPQGGGRNCSGTSEQWTPCNTHACQLPDGENSFDGSATSRDQTSEEDWERALTEESLVPDFDVVAPPAKRRGWLRPFWRK